MCALKRILPFISTLFVGLALASFFARFTLLSPIDFPLPNTKIVDVVEACAYGG